MKSALIVLSNECIHLISEIPRILKNGGFQVTVISHPHWSLARNSYIDQLIETSIDPVLAIHKAAEVVKIRSRPFDLTILSTDPLIWALLDSQIEPQIKSLLYPIQNKTHLEALQGKIGVSALCKKLNLPAPPSRAASSKKEAVAAAIEFGFPVMLKISRSGAGNGVWKCNSVEEIEQAPIPLDPPFLVEKYLEGDLISVEPLFLNSRLIAYNYSIMTVSPKPFQPSIERILTPCPEIEPLLIKIGKETKMSGFGNLSFIRNRESKEHFLFELDFRPNRWVPYGKFVGVDWAKTLLDPSAPLQKPLITKSFAHFPSELWNALKTRNKTRILYWLLNRNQCWKLILQYDINLLICGICRLIKRRLNLFN